MTSRELLIHRADRAALLSSEFLWQDANAGPSSFHVSVDPELAAIGDVPKANRDVVALAIAIFLSDRTVPRSRRWERDIELRLPVFDPQQWNVIKPRLQAVLNVLTSDTWSLSFTQRGNSPKVEPAARPEVDIVSLFSGGADSLAGAIKALNEGNRVLLVSHWDWSVHAGYQRTLSKWLNDRFPDQVYHRKTQVGRAQRRPGGVRFANEPSRRGRSLLFIGLGTAHASVEPALQLWIPENGYSSLNPPLAGERRGSLSTRTTHPYFLAELKDLLIEAGAHAEFTNPFASMTKGEVFAATKSALGADAAAEVLSMSHSCAHARWAIGTGYSPATQCGICYGCLVRRAAFMAADIPDRSVYFSRDVPANQQPAHLSGAARSEVRTVEYAVTRGITTADLLADGLPIGVEIDTAVNLANRGLHELEHLISTARDLKSL